ncbi:MAG: glutamate-1-semialdehyde 2,1-aminomutase [Fusobacterium perfoetens]|uniref:glutamate-1-semialdehyde 2,1-aminomutase n=1 Tax=Fusobacterium perfoetens TaxID=852 RepID=UPI0023EFD351|nr:glutamate-1-semialdehyde 2,1-aminomutase [Fusobacterium perfoetens]MCI6152421.1 glutamate-1-semialdehyde 2,1-aminomutase [Fusobacterium perfoetens]MDY3237020.1 glutamate-1-semialdehyde 2,1-aminomutase [Fusobacterium perfoetens]
MSYQNSKNIYDEAIKFIPGGVNSPVRAFKSVNREAPIFVKKAKGSKLWDEDGNKYIDYICSWGPMILGHNFERVIAGVRDEIENGSSYGLPTKLEVELAKLITNSCPSIEKVRLTTSGTEATMSAVRLARAYTMRNKILKFEGCYHGHSDALLVKSGSGLLTDGYQDSNGITAGVLQDTLTVPFGSREKIQEILEKEDVACLIMEPVPANMGVITPDVEFLKFVREICTKTKTVLIFDEVISGFRLSLGGAQEYFGITPDMTTLGKIIGGGYPVGAFGGKKEIMDLVAPIGRVYHAGTLSGNPISVRAGLETIGYLYENRETIYKTLEEKTKYITTELEKIAREYNVPVCINRLGSLYTIFFTDRKEVNNLEDALSSNTENFAIYFNEMLDNGIVIPPSQFEAHFISLALSDEDIEKTLKVARKAFEKISKK